MFTAGGGLLAVTGLGAIVAVGPAAFADTTPTTAKAEVASTITTSGAQAFTLAGAPGAATDTASALNAKTNNTAGYNVTVLADSEYLLPAGTEANTDVIPVFSLEVLNTDEGYTGLSTTVPVTVHTQTDRSIEDGDALTDGYQLTTRSPRRQHPLVVLLLGLLISSALSTPALAADDPTGPATFDLTVDNRGNVHRLFEESIRLLASNGDAEFSCENFTVLGDSTRVVQAVWPDPPLLCWCTMDVEIDDGQGNLLIASTRVVAFPRRLSLALLALTAGLALLAVGRRRRRTARFDRQLGVARREGTNIATTIEHARSSPPTIEHQPQPGDLAMFAARGTHGRQPRRRRQP